MPKAVEGALKKMSLSGKRPVDDDDDDDEDDDDYDPEADGDDDNDDDDEGIDLKGVVLNRVKHLRVMHTSMDSITAEYKKERIALEEKYRVQKEALYETRRKIVVGEFEPEKLPLEEGEDPDDDEDDDNPPKGVPQFWMRALANHESIADNIEEEDLPLLEKLINITCEYDEAYTTFTLTFYFEENEYMENTTLTKKYIVQPDLIDDAPMLDECFGTEIKWKEGKDLTVAEIKKKQKAKSGKNKGQVRVVTRKEPKRSFFNYFSDPIEDKDEEDEEEEEDDDNVKLTFEQDYDIGYAIRVDVIPDAVAWFTGEALGYEEGEDGDEDDEDDDGEDGGEKGPKVISDGKGGFTTVPGADGQQQECKQS